MQTADVKKRISQILSFALPLSLLFQSACSRTLNIHARPANAISGSAFAKSIASLERPEREEKIYRQIALGNVPDFLRRLAPVHVQSVQNGKTNAATYYVTPDYLAVGSDDDYFLTPLTPCTAQRVANLLHCTLPTRKMVDDIYSAAAVKLTPSPIPPTPAMITVPVFIQHNSIVAKQRREQLAEHPLGALVAGDKKDVVLSNKLRTNPGNVAIYGWHKPDGKPIQPLYVGHADTWADYSHGIRLVQLSLKVNGASTTIPAVLANPALDNLLSDEGPISNSKYPTTSQSGFKTKAATIERRPVIKAVALSDFRPGAFNERTISYTIDPEVKVHINAPAAFAAGKKVKLIFYTLPNGNTTEQTIGKQLKPKDDWHYDIQHIGAQTRFLRNLLKDYNVVVVYLEADEKTVPKSWPIWRKAHSDNPRLIPQMVSSIKNIFKGYDVQVTLSGHSGGGSFIFGYINGVDRIPDYVERLAFLDSNYAYDKTQGHLEKMERWLKASNQHYLSVLAYNDAVALLNGKTFVSAAGGTWGRSHAMLNDLEPEMKFTSQTNSELETYSALNGRVKFLLKENPEKKIFHTVQVEKNGFIQSILSGTPLEGSGYVYFGDRAYTNWIATQ
jgi:hypothetical protein